MSCSFYAHDALVVSLHLVRLPSCAKCDSSPSWKTDCFRWTNSSNLWMCFQVTMGSNNIDRKYLAKALQCFPHIVNSYIESFLLYIFMLKSVRRSMGVWDKVWRTHTHFALFLFIRLVLFLAQCYSCWISFFFLPIWGWKYSCITLKVFECRFRFSMYWVINVPFIELSLALSIWHIIH